MTLGFRVTMPFIHDQHYDEYLGRERGQLSGGEEGGKNASQPPSIHTCYLAKKKHIHERNLFN